MNQSMVIKHAPESFTSCQNNNNVVSLSKARNRQRAVRAYRNNMKKQKLMGLGLLLICIIVTMITKDITAAIIISPMAFMMVFSKKCVMQFNLKK